MAKTILVPVDLRIESLNTLRFALEQQSEPVSVVLLYGNLLTESITELIFYSPQRIILSRMDSQFQQALEIIRNRFGKVLSEVRIELLNSLTLSVLKNMIQHNRVDIVYVPKTYMLQPGKKGFDPVPLLKKAQVPVEEIDWSNQKVSDRHDPLHTLFPRKD